MHIILKSQDPARRCLGLNARCQLAEKVPRDLHMSLCQCSIRIAFSNTSLTRFSLTSQPLQFGTTGSKQLRLDVHGLCVKLLRTTLLSFASH